MLLMEIKEGFKLQCESTSKDAPHCLHSSSISETATETTIHLKGF